VISFRCPTCGNGFGEPDTSAGKCLQCPNCNEMVRVPGGVARRGTWSRYRWPLTGVAMTMILGTALLFAGLKYSSKARKPDPLAPSTLQAAASGAPTARSEVAILSQQPTTAVAPPPAGRHLVPILAADHEGVHVAIRSIRIGNVLVDKQGTQGETEKEYLTLGIGLANKTSRKVSFSGWSHAEGVTLVDNLGNKYPQLRVPSGTVVAGQCETASIQPQQSTTDLLIFRPPLDKSESMTLQLPATNFGGNGYLTFNIPRLRWLKPTNGD
jgi:hypothetical protein